jgi:hypothetical protein
LGGEKGTKVMIPEKASKVKKNLPSIKVLPKPLDLLEIAFQDFPLYDLDQQRYMAEWEATRRIKAAYLDFESEPPSEMPAELWDTLVRSKHIPDGLDPDDFADAIEDDWLKVQVPFGFSQCCQVALIRGTQWEIPENLYRSKKTRDKTQRLLNLLMVLAAIKENGEFFCTTRQAGDFLGIPHTSAARLFKRLQRHKIILLAGSRKQQLKSIPIYHLGSLK